jgi:hypothetical protein
MKKKLIRLPFFFVRVISKRDIIIAFALALIFFVSASSYANQFQLFTEQETTSDRLIRTTWGVQYRSHRRDLFWPYINSQSKQFDWGISTRTHSGKAEGIEFFGATATALLAYQFSDSDLLESTVGTHQLKNASNQSVNTSTVYELKYSNIFAKKVESILSLNRDLIYHEMLLPAGVVESIFATTLKLSNQFHFSEKQRVRSQIKQRWFSNQKKSQLLELNYLYGFATSEPWIWGGIGCEYLNYDQSIVGMWSPKDFFSYGPRFEGSFQLLSNWALIMGININRLVDNQSHQQGWGYYSSLKMMYGQRESSQGGLSLTRIESQQAGNDWNSTIFGFEFNSAF